MEFSRLGLFLMNKSELKPLAENLGIPAPKRFFGQKAFLRAIIVALIEKRRELQEALETSQKEIHRIQQISDRRQAELNASISEISKELLAAKRQNGRLSQENMQMKSETGIAALVGRLEKSLDDAKKELKKEKKQSLVSFTRTLKSTNVSRFNPPLAQDSSDSAMLSGG